MILRVFLCFNRYYLSRRKLWIALCAAAGSRGGCLTPGLGGEALRGVVGPESSRQGAHCEAPIAPGLKALGPDLKRVLLPKVLLDAIFCCSTHRQNMDLLELEC